MQTFTAVVHKEDDLYVAECPEIGTASQGKSIEEAIRIFKKLEFMKPIKKGNHAIVHGVTRDV